MTGTKRPWATQKQTCAPSAPTVFRGAHGPAQRQRHNNYSNQVWHKEENAKSFWAFICSRGPQWRRRLAEEAEFLPEPLLRQVLRVSDLKHLQTTWVWGCFSTFCQQWNSLKSRVRVRSHQFSQNRWKSQWWWWCWCLKAEAHGPWSAGRCEPVCFCCLRTSSAALACSLHETPTLTTETRHTCRNSQDVGPYPLD